MTIRYRILQAAVSLTVTESSCPIQCSPGRTTLRRSFAAVWAATAARVFSSPQHNRYMTIPRLAFAVCSLPAWQDHGQV